MTAPSDDSPEKSDFSNAATSGGRWGLARSVLVQVIGVLSTAVFARLLTRTEFGLVAATMSVVLMFELVVQAGYGNALVRRRRLDHKIVSTSFWTAFGVGFVALLAALGASSLAARLLAVPDAAPLIAIAASSIPLSLASSALRGVLLREFRYRSLMIGEVSASVIYLAAATGMAISGLGAYSLVIGQVIKTVVTLGYFTAVSPYRPRLTFSKVEAKADLRFNVATLGSQTLGYLGKNVDYWIVSNRLGPDVLGVYYVAFVIPNLIRQRITHVAREVLFPIVARLRDDQAQAGRAMMRTITFASAVTMPLMIGLALTADIAVEIAFGDRWEAAVAPLRVLALAAAVLAVWVPASSVAEAYDRPQANYLPASTSLLVLAGGASLAIGLGYGITGVAWASFAAAATQSLLIGRLVRRFVGLPIRRQLGALVPVIGASAVMALAVYGLRELLPPVFPILEALIVVPVGVAIYVLSLRQIDRSTFQALASDLGRLSGISSRIKRRSAGG